MVTIHMSTPQGRDRVRIESPSNVGKPSEVYVSGVRSSSTPQISAAAAQRIELTCDADACGAQAPRASCASCKGGCVAILSVKDASRA